MSKQGIHGISWTDQTWNPVRGCSRVSQGCVNCYAERVAARFSGGGQPYEGLAKMTPSGPRWTGKIQLVEDHLLDPLRWRRPRRVFVNSMSDLFHEALTDVEIGLVFAVMALSQHQFQVLTKRPQRMLDWFTKMQAGAGRWAAQIGKPFSASDLLNLQWMHFRMNQGPAFPYGPWPLPNVWLGVSVEDQATADERIPLLLQTPAAVRFISAEPLLGQIDLSHDTEIGVLSWLEPVDECPRVDWVIAGGESGPGARPMKIEWAESLQRQCASADVAFWMKQLDGKRKELADFPEGLRVREFPV